MGLFNFLLKDKIIKIWEKDNTNVLNFVTSMGKREMQEIRASAIAALAFFSLDPENQKDGSLELALAIMESANLRLNKQEKVLLSAFNLRQMENQKQAYQSSSVMNRMVASGIPIWITSIR
ncbi:hypothetical protein [Saezia sanguinis]|uniref:hypothetical protein n=1 Tax=Saezia sanguinis TaxID=1965230 RepID=UPI0030600F97